MLERHTYRVTCGRKIDFAGKVIVPGDERLRENRYISRATVRNNNISKTIAVNISYCYTFRITVYMKSTFAAKEPTVIEPALPILRYTETSLE